MSYSWGVGLSSARTEGIPIVRPSIDAPPRIDDVPRRGRGGPPEGTDLHQVAAALAPMVDVWRRLLVQHVPDRVGRCRTCTKGGTGLPVVPWPCSLHGIADLARRRHEAELAARERMRNERVS